MDNYTTDVLILLILHLSKVKSSFRTTILQLLFCISIANHMVTLKYGCKKDAKIYLIARMFSNHGAKSIFYKMPMPLPLSSTPLHTHQVIYAQEERLDAAIALAIPAGRDAQIYPHQLRQELQGEASQAIFRAPVKLEQLVAHRLQELDWRRK